MAKVASYVGHIAKQRNPSYKRVTRDVRQDRVCLSARDIEQAHLALGIRLFGRTDKRRFALKILNVILGENMSSRLFQTVRETHGLAYSVNSSVHLLEDTGTLVVSAGLDRKRHQQALRLIVKELKRLKTVRVGRSELAEAKDYAIGHMKLAVESTTNQMIWIGESTLQRDDFMPPEQIIESLKSVTADDVQNLSHTIFRKQRISTALIAPGLTDEDKKVLQDKIQVL